MKRRLSRRFNHWVVRFFGATGLTPLRAVVAILLLVGVGCLIYWTGFRKVESAVISQQSVEDQYSVETDEILESMLARSDRLEPTNYFLTESELQALGEELTEFEKSRRLNPSQEVMVGHFRFSLESFSLQLMLRNKINTDAKKREFLDVCSRYLDSPNEASRRQAKFWVCVIRTVNFVEEPSTESYQRFVETIDEHKATYISNPRRSKYLANLVLLLSENDFKNVEFQQKAVSRLSERLAESETEGVLEIVEILQQHSLFGKFNLSTLRRRIAWLDPGAESDLDNAIELLQTHPQSDIKVWKAIIGAYESFLASDRAEEVGESLDKLKILSEKIEDPDNRKHIQERLAHQQVRVAAVEKKFDIAGTKLPDGQPISTGNRDYMVVIFCEPNRSSSIEYQRICSVRDRSGFSVIAAFSGPLSDEELVEAAKLGEGISVATMETSRKYLSEFPADVLPYALLLNKSGHIIAANLQYDQIESRIAKAKAGSRSPFE